MLSSHLFQQILSYNNIFNNLTTICCNSEGFLKRQLGCFHTDGVCIQRGPPARQSVGRFVVRPFTASEGGMVSWDKDFHIMIIPLPQGLA